MDSSFNFSWPGRGGASFVPVLGGGSASFRCYGVGEEVNLGFSIARSPAFEDPRGRSRLGA